MQIKHFVKSKAFKILAVFISLFAVCALSYAKGGDSALTSGIGLTDITGHVNDTVKQMARILTDVALIAGIGFILASFFKFHQHKLNPTQVPISQGVTLLIIGACLTLFVVMLPTAKRAIFGSAPIAQIGGTGMSKVIGGDSSKK